MAWRRAWAAGVGGGGAEGASARDFASAAGATPVHPPLLAFYSVFW